MKQTPLMLKDRMKSNGEKNTNFTVQRRFSKDILEICAPIFNLFNITFFSHTRVFRDGHFTSLMSSTELTEYYIRQKYPIRFNDGKGYLLKSGFYLGNYIDSPTYNPIKNDISERFKLDHFVYIIDKQDKHDDMYAFATTPENGQIINQYINNMEVFRKFILYYKDKSSKLINKTPLVKYEDEYFSLAQTLQNDILACVNETERDMCLKNMLPRKIKVSSRLGEVNISQREFECLKYVVKNYTIKQTAKFLNLSPRTVETYLNNLKIKLGVDQRSQLTHFFEELNLS